MNYEEQVEELKASLARKQYALDEMTKVVQMLVRQREELQIKLETFGLDKDKLISKLSSRVADLEITLNLKK
jgi:predicted RNase H-like nuclease (RuvC/YqgF family)